HPATADIATLSLHDALPIFEIQPSFSVYGVGIIQPNNVLRVLNDIGVAERCCELGAPFPGWRLHDAHGNHLMDAPNDTTAAPDRSEEHTSELQSRENLVCRL